MNRDWKVIEATGEWVVCDFCGDSIQIPPIGNSWRGWMIAIVQCIKYCTEEEKAFCSVECRDDYLAQHSTCVVSHYI